MVYHPCGRPQMPFMNLSPHWTPQHTKLEILWLGLNINLCHSRATADSQAHRTVFCGKFGTHFTKYSKPGEFCNYRYAGLWWPICSSIQINDRISSRKGNIRNFIISTSVCDCAECACWLSLVMRHCQFIFWYVTLQQPEMGMISSFLEPFANLTYLDWLTCPNGDILSYSNTTECWLLLRQCSGTALVYLWENVLVLGKKVSLLISFEASRLFILSLKQKVVSHPGKV